MSNNTNSDPIATQEIVEETKNDGRLGDPLADGGNDHDVQAATVPPVPTQSDVDLHGVEETKSTPIEPRAGVRQEPRGKSAKSHTSQQFRREWGKAAKSPGAFKLVYEEEFDEQFLDNHARSYAREVCAVVKREVEGKLGVGSRATPCALLKLYAGDFLRELMLCVNEAYSREGRGSISTQAWCKWLGYLIVTFIVGKSASTCSKMVTSCVAEKLELGMQRERFDDILSRLAPYKDRPNERQLDDRTSGTAGVPRLEAMITGSFARFWMPDCYYSLDDSKWKTKSKKFPGIMCTFFINY